MTYLNLPLRVYDCQPDGTVYVLARIGSAMQFVRYSFVIAASVNQFRTIQSPKIRQTALNRLWM